MLRRVFSPIRGGTKVCVLLSYLHCADPSTPAPSPVREAMPRWCIAGPLAVEEVVEEVMPPSRYILSGASMPTRYSPSFIAVLAASVRARRAVFTPSSSSMMRFSK